VAFVVFGVQIVVCRRRAASCNSPDDRVTAMACGLLISCSAMTKDPFQTLSTEELANVGGGLGGWFRNRFPLAAAGLRRFAFGPGANAAAGAGSGCAGGGCSGGGCAG